MTAIVAQACLYGAEDTGLAYLASLAGQASIVAKGGWNAAETRPSGDVRSLTDIVQDAKEDLRALGVRAGDLAVFFPGGEQCARTPVDLYQPVEDMWIERASRMEVSDAAIARAARDIVQLGATASGKPIPRVPARLARLERAAAGAVDVRGRFDEPARAAIRAAQSAERAHFDAYAGRFTARDHRDAVDQIEEHKGGMPRAVQHVLDNLESMHRRAALDQERRAHRTRTRRRA